MDGFCSLTADWFRGKFGQATPAQAEAWPLIREGGDLLISAPTGSGKTLAAFLSCIDRLVSDGLDGHLDDRTSVVYVSPLKALSNDIHRNLQEPLKELGELAEASGAELAEIRTAIRTGDTPAWEREQMVRRPPHILVTTPESLFILLTAERSRKMLSTAATVIVDEIHAVLDDKRGAHLAVSLARLDHLVREAGGSRPQRIGLSATVKPIIEVASFLTGEVDGGETAIVDSGHRRELDLAVEVPEEELGAVATTGMWGEIYDRIAELILSHRTTIVFVNTRRLAERVAHQLAERLGDDAVLSHHGSLSRRLRQAAEAALKEGRLRAIVATASLELGIDVGSVDLVCQIGTPRSIAVALQRIGRSGHKVDRTFIPKGRFFPATRDELVECAALVRAIRSGLLDERTVMPWPRDVLAQQIVAAAATGDWDEDELFDLVRSAYPYRDLPRDIFDEVVAMLSDGIASSRGRNGAWLHRDRVNGVVRGRRGARLAAITSGGAIPDNANYQVVAEPEGTTVGTVDEDFAVESLAGDVFLLGTTSWRIRRVEAGRVRVEDAHGAAPSVPFWLGEAPGRTRELSDEVSRVRERLAAANADDDAIAFLVRECGLDRPGAEQAVAYLRAGVRVLGATPSNRTLVAERFFDESGGMQLVLHAPLGARINRAWGLALRKRFCRSFNVELQAAATDNGLVISLAEQHSFPLEVVFRFLQPATVEDVLTQAMLPSPMFGARWRWNASRALAILRFAGGKKVPPPILRMRSDDLLAAVFPDQVACAENLSGEIRIPQHPLVDETIRDCLHEAMDIDGLRELVAGIEAGTIATHAIDTAEPSPLGHEILNANPYAFLDDAPLEERRARAVQLRRTLGDDGAEIGALDEAAIREVADEAWPVVRDPEELHDALLTLVLVPPRDGWRDWFARLAETGRATTLTPGAPAGAPTHGAPASRPADGPPAEGPPASTPARATPPAFWVATERLRTARLVHPGAVADPDPPDIEQPVPDGVDAAVTEVLRGWLDSVGPMTAAALAATLALPEDRIAAALTRLEGEGQVLRGRFTAAARADGAETEWCNRRVLARIHRLTLGRLRREIEPVTSADLVRFLARWQRMADGTRLHGASGLLQVIQQLQGCEVSAAAWERDVLAARMAKYDPEMLDQLCLSGEVMWGRLSPHPAFDARNGDEQGEPANRRARRVRPTRVAPVALFLREDLEWLLPPGGHPAGPEMPALSHPARAVLDALQRRGASFLRELVQETGRLTSEVEDGLWELVAAGLVTADGFDNLRALTNPKRRRGEGRFRAARPRHAAGRWALLAPGSRDLQAGAGEPAERERADAFARQLLLRWGVVFRDLVRRETLMPPWRDLLASLRRMEARGEVRGGRFVAGFVGEQFARPDAVELLRIVRRDGGRIDRGRGVRVAAADPMNLAGIVTPGARVSALSGEVVELLPPAPVAAGAAAVQE
ncbi:MAG: DEAD/DEAH box helicase [Acidobacteria bacterium]|nr:DEAD/DEAH box helicase [Acidobacteriota bacterium]